MKTVVSYHMSGNGKNIYTYISIIQQSVDVQYYRKLFRLK